MKIYLPGYYLRSLRNQPLTEIDAEEVTATIQGHQHEVRKTRTNRNLKAFEEISRENRVVKVLDDRLLRAKPIDVPLVQEFIRKANDEKQPQSKETENLSLIQTLNSIAVDINLLQNNSVTGSSNDKQNDSNLETKLSSIQSCCDCLPSNIQRIPTVEAPYSLEYHAQVPQQAVFHSKFVLSNDTHFPKVFKAKLQKNLRDSLMKSPNFNAVRIRNLSYSQPSTPKTPIYRSFLCATPRVQKNTDISTPSLSQFVPFTPMLHEAVRLLDSIPEKYEENDLLNIIDDDTKPVEMVDKELDLYSEVNDANVADYVLNIVNDYQIQKEKHTFQKVPNVDLSKRRKCYRAKPVFLEESEVYQEQKRKKDKERRQKRKELFEQKSPLGTRRSKRKLRPPPRI